MNAENSMWDSWPLGNGPPVHHYPPAPTCTDYGDDESSLPIPFDLVTAADDTQYAANILAAFKARQRSAPTRKNFQNTNGHSRVVETQEEDHNINHHGNLKENLGKRYKRENHRRRNNDLRPQMVKGDFHILGAYPNDLLRDAEVFYPVLSIPEAQRERKQPTVEDAKDNVKPHRPAITPLNPDFLIPSKPPSPILPKATEPNNTLRTTEIRSMWHNYYISLDRASETRYIKALRRAGYTVTKRSARGILQHKKESRRRKAASNDVKEPWYMYRGDTNGAEGMEFRHCNRRADQHGMRDARSVESETQSRVQPSKPAVTQKHASRRTKQHSDYNSSYERRPLSSIPQHEGVAKPMEEINAADTTLRSRATEQKNQAGSKAEVPFMTPQTEATEQEKKNMSTNAKDIGSQMTEKTEQPKIRLPGHRRPMPEGIKVSDIREQAPGVAVEEWLVNLANEKERGLRLDKKCEEPARLTKKQYPNLPSTAELRRLCKPMLDRLDRKREEAEQKREAKLKKVVNLQNAFKIPEIKLPEFKLPEIKLPETQCPENNLPKDPSSPSSPILSPMIYFRNTEPHSPSYMMSGALPFEYVDVDMEDARST